MEKVNQQVITRSRTGNLPPAKPVVETGEVVKVAVSGKASAEEIKEKMEQQLRLQRAAHQQKRALEVKNVTVKSGQLLEVVGSTATGKSFNKFLYNHCPFIFLNSDISGFVSFHNFIATNSLLYNTMLIALLLYKKDLLNRNVYTFYTVNTLL